MKSRGEFSHFDFEPSIHITTNVEAGCYVHYVRSLNRTDFFIKELRPFLDGKSRDNSSILVIFPSYKEGKVFRGTIYDRCSTKLKIDSRNEFVLIEAIDDSAYYKCAKSLDQLIEEFPRSRKPHKKLQKLLYYLSFKKKLMSMIGFQKIGLRKSGTAQRKTYLIDYQILCVLLSNLHLMALC